MANKLTVGRLDKGYRLNQQSCGFYKLYQIDKQRTDNNAKSGREQRGLKSLYGQRGAICAYFHWTWEYLTKGIAWGVVQRMMEDQARYDDEDDKPNGRGKFEETDEMVLTEENADDFINYINSL